MKDSSSVLPQADKLWPGVTLGGNQLVHFHAMEIGESLLLQGFLYFGNDLPKFGGLV